MGVVRQNLGRIYRNSILNLATISAISQIHKLAPLLPLKYLAGNSSLMITYRYRLKPSRTQAETLGRHIEICRQVYNRMLGEVTRGRAVGSPLSWYRASSLLRQWKTGDFPEMREVHSRVAMMAAKRLFGNLASLAGKKRHGGKVGRLRFKGKGGYNSIAYNQSGFEVDPEHEEIHFSKVGAVRTVFHRSLPPGCRVKGIVVKRTGTRKWIACLQCEERQESNGEIEANIADRAQAALASGGRAVGIDLGITHFVADSSGHYAESPQYLQQSLAKVKKLQKKLSRKKKASNRRQKAKFALAKLHEKVANQRRDYLHKLSRYHVANYDVICAEDLAVAGMLQEKRAGFGKKANTTLHRHVAGAGWRAFLDMLAYKARSAGKLAIFVDPRGTSQECAACEVTVPKQLWSRTHLCPHCGFTADRDTNASLVILKRGTGRAPTPVELAPLLQLAGASAGAEAGTRTEYQCILLQ